MADETIDVRCAAADSTCQKRVTVCEIYDIEGNLLACESNRCNPIGGTCHRLNIKSVKQKYPSVSVCDWDHAEQRAVAALPAGSRPYRAVLYGHDFPCEDCKSAVRGAGVDVIEIIPNTQSTGLRSLGKLPEGITSETRIRELDGIGVINNSVMDNISSHWALAASPCNMYQTEFQIPSATACVGVSDYSALTDTDLNMVEVPEERTFYEAIGEPQTQPYAPERLTACPTLYVNLFAGPGSGKSTLRAGVFYALKSIGINCEEAPEYAKDKTWQEDSVTLGCQFYVTGKQIFRMKRLRGKVRVVITDSPILIGLLYQDADCGPGFAQAVLEQFNSYDNLNYVLHRDPKLHKYNPSGRKQSEAESIEKDGEVQTLLDNLQVPYTPIKMRNDKTVNQIVADILVQIGAVSHADKMKKPKHKKNKMKRKIIDILVKNGAMK